MKEDDYYYCIVHKKSILPEDKEAHETDECQFIIETCRISTPVKIHKLWMAKTIAEKCGMQVFKLPPKQKTVVFTLPSDAVLLDSKTESKDLSQT